MTYRLKLDEFWKIQEMLYVIGTEIFQFRPLGAKEIAFKKFILAMQFYPQDVSWKLGFVLEGSKTFNLMWYSSVGSVLESSCHQLSNAYWNSLIITKNVSENWVWKVIPGYPTLKDSLLPESDCGPQSSSNPIISAHHEPNPNIPVPIK